MLLSAASATMKPFFVTSIGNVLLNMQSDSVRIDIDIAMDRHGRTTMLASMVAMLVTSTSSCWWCWCWCWRWRRLRDVTLPTLQAQRDADADRARLQKRQSQHGAECNYFHVADRDEVRCMATQWGICSTTPLLHHAPRGCCDHLQTVESSSNTI